MEIKTSGVPTPSVSVGRQGPNGTPVKAVIADMGVVDLDGDCYKSGAFRDCGTQLISQWDHNSLLGAGGAIPVGQGIITEENGLAIFRGVLWTEMQAAQDVAAMLRRRGMGQPWSYGYDVVDSAQIYRDGKSVRELRAVDAHEVSPVRRAAGLGTQTLEIGEQAKWLKYKEVRAEREMREELMRVRNRLMQLDLELGHRR